MNKKHIITIAGKPGSGKSTTSKTIAESLGYKHFSSGDFFREISKNRGIDVLQANIIAETEQSIDTLVDSQLQEIGEKENNLVIDSRMAWHWMPYSFRVYLDLDILTAAQRIIDNTDQKRKSLEDISEKPEEYANQLQERLNSEIKRYMNLYNANPYQHDNYDLVVDTNIHTLPEVIDIIITAYNKWKI